MNKKHLAIIPVLLGSYAPLVSAAPTTYSFDTLTKVSIHASAPSLTGVLRNDTSPATLTFVDNTNISFRYVVNRCVPVFLTMLEKPGRYFLNVTVDPATSNVQLISCELELRD
jgi:hypothetical protein